MPIKNTSKSAIGFYGLIACLPLWYILHANNEYFGLIALQLSVRYLLEYLLITAVFAVISHAFFKDKYRVFIFTFGLFAFYFLFGAVQDLLRSNSIPKWVVSYTFLVPLMLILILLFWYYLRRSHPSRQVSAYKYLKWLLIIFLSIEISLLAFHFSIGENSKNYLSPDVKKLAKSDTCLSEKPDIFFIVLDEYPSSKSLKEDLFFDNGEMDTVFQRLGFFTSGLSNSNYNVTPYSMAATFQMEYLRAGVEDASSPEQFLGALNTFRYNKLVPFISEHGYEVLNYGCFEIENTYMKTERYFDHMYSDLVNGSTFPSRFKKHIGWHFSHLNPFSSGEKVPKDYAKKKEYHLYRNKFNLDMLASELASGSPNPRFVIAHIMIPHEPFYLKSDGSLVPDSEIISNTLPPREGFLGQVQYINEWLKEHLPVSVKNTGRTRVVIIQGDHGYRFFEKKEDREKEFRNLNVFYFSDKDYAQLYDGISPVNTFRVVLNKYFCQSLPLLPDSSIYIRNW